MNVILTLSPQRIVLGGVMEHWLLFTSIRGKVRGFLNGYIASPLFTGTMEEYIVPPASGKRSGVLSEMVLAKSRA